MVKLAPKLKKTRTTPIYNIGATSRLTGVPVWRLRWLEDHRLVSPKRTGGNQRLFSEEEIDAVSAIAELLAQGVNLAGVRIIIRMRTGGTAP